MTDRIEVLRDVLTARGRMDRPPAGPGRLTPERAGPCPLHHRRAAHRRARPTEHPPRAGRLVLLRLGQLRLLHHGHRGLPRPVPDRDRRERGRLRTDDACRDATVYPLGIAGRAGSFYPYVLSLSVHPAGAGPAGHRRDRRPVRTARASCSALFAYIGAGATIGFFFLTGDRYLLGGAAVPDRQRRLRREHRRLQLVPAPAGQPGRPGQGVQHRLGASATSAAACCSLLNLVALIVGRTDTDGAGSCALVARLGRRLVGRLHHAAAAHAARTGRRSTSCGPEGRPLTDGFQQLWHTLKGLRAYPLTLFFLDRLPDLQRRHPDRHRRGQRVRRRSSCGSTPDAQIITILIVQFLAFGGALLLGRIARVVRRLEDGAGQPRAVDRRRHRGVLPAGRRGRCRS